MGTKATEAVVIVAGRPWWMPVVEALGIGALGVLLGIFMVRLASEVQGWVEVMLIVAAGIAGYFAADFLSGTAHWFCDTFFEEESPLIGRMLIHPFREHHRAPRKMTEHGFLELTGNSALALTPVAGVVLWVRERGQAGAAGLMEIFGDGFIVALCLGLFATNLFHKWAHLERPGRWISWLQQKGLILEPEHHERHHTAPNRKAYCVTSGWANRIADRFGVFSGMEKVLKAAGIPLSKTVIF